MSEAIITRRNKTIIETITNIIYKDIENIIYDPPLSDFIPMSMNYTVPTNLLGNQITVALAAPKGADNDTDSGLNGELSIQTLTVEPGEVIPVYIGNEGVNGDNGGSSSFGTYMVANGGLSADNSIIAAKNNSFNSTTAKTNTSGAGYAIVWYATDDFTEEATEQ